MPLSSIINLKQKEKLFFPAVFKNGPTIDALVHSTSHVSAIAQTELDRFNQQAPNNIIKFDYPTNVHLKVVNDQIEKLSSSVTLEIDVGVENFGKTIVVMKRLTGLVIGLLSKELESLVIDATHCLIHFLHLTLLVKNSNNGTIRKPNLSSAMINLEFCGLQPREPEILLIVHQNGTQHVL